MVHKFFDKKSKGSGIAASLANKSANENFIQQTNFINQLLENLTIANELHKPIIRKFKKRKVYSYFRDNIQGC